MWLGPKAGKAMYESHSDNYNQYDLICGHHSIVFKITLLREEEGYHINRADSQ